MAFGPISVEMDTFADCVGSCCEPVACPERMREMDLNDEPFNITIELEAGCAGDPCWNGGLAPLFECFPYSGVITTSGTGMRWEFSTASPSMQCNCGNVALVCTDPGPPGLDFSTSCCVTTQGGMTQGLVSIQYSPLVMVFRLHAGYLGYCGAVFNEDTLSYDCEECYVLVTVSE
jgi:hypothetical protein